MKRVEDGLAKVARQRELAEQVAMNAKEDVERLVLGPKPLAPSH
jgi:hypothetical protein